MGTCGSWTATSASSRSSRRISLWASESRSSSVSALKARPEHGDLAVRQRAQATLDPLDQEQRHRLVHARDGEQHPGRVRALLREREVLAQARPGGQAGQGDPAAGVVAVDQVDHVEHVRRVALAVHHQQVRQREVRVAQDVRPDLRELGLHGRRLHDRRFEGREQLRGDLAGARADAADDAGQRVDLLEEAPRGDPLRRVRDEHVLADLKAAVLGQIAGHELGRARRDRRAQDQRVPRREHPEQVVERRADVAHVDLDVRERRGAERDHDVPRAGRRRRRARTATADRSQ